MSIKIIFTDLDGTLLSGGQVAISERNMAALNEAAKRGILIVPCTGRCVDMLPPQLLTSDFFRYAVSCHGARVYDRKMGVSIYESGFTPEESYEILKIFEGRGIYAEIAANNRIYVEKDVDENLKKYPVPIHHDWYMRDRRYVAVDNISEYFLQNGIGIDKVNIYGMPEEVREEIYNRLLATGIVEYTYPWVSADLEFGKTTTSKKDAVKTLLKHLGIKKEEVFAIGDSHADVDLLELAGIPVAMKNAIDALKAVAKYETDLNTNDGVGKAIEKYVLNDGSDTPPAPIEEFKRQKDYLICVDSDGCAVDTMEIKQKECFSSAMIEVFGLQGIAKYAREAWEFANLYSKTRGFYRMKTLVITMELLARRKEVIDRKFQLPDLSELKKWMETSKVLSDATLLEYAKAHSDKTLYTVLDWSADVNQRIKRIVKNVPPFPYVRESLQKIQEKADVVVVSATPTAALMKEWTEHDIKKYTSFICGQEYGTKKDVIEKIGKQYGAGRVIMLGDALGDYQSAMNANALFYPICPNTEDQSWKAFYETVYDLFVNGNYTMDVQKQYVDQLNECLADQPAWEI